MEATTEDGDDEQEAIDRQGELIKGRFGEDE